MSKKLVDRLTKALKDAGVEIKDDVKDALSEALGSESLKAAGLVELGSGDVVVQESKYNELSEDLRKEKVKRREAETRRDELQQTLNAGDSDNKKRADKLDERNRVLEPLTEKLVKRARADWASKSARVPGEPKADAKDDEKLRVGNIRKEFVFAEKDKELTDDQVLANLDMFDRLDGIGVFGEQKPAPTQETRPMRQTAVPRTNPGVTGDTETTDEAYLRFFGAETAGNAR